jgi:hypothetical protein
MPDELKLDRKFFGEVFKSKDGSKVPESQWMVFLAKDNAVPATLRFYRTECERLGAKKTQLDAVDAMIQRVDRYRVTYPQLCKVPDATHQELAKLPIRAVS